MGVLRHNPIPRRIFLDTCTFQAMNDCGGYVFGEDPPPTLFDCPAHTVPQLLFRPDALEILESLKLIFMFNDRAHFDWIVSEGSIAEVLCNPRRLRYLVDIMNHSLVCLSDNPPGRLADRMVAHIDSPQCGYVSAKDRRLLREAAAAECDTFLTIERKLPRISETLLRAIPLRIATPKELWVILEPQLKGL